MERSRGKRRGENGHREHVPDVDKYGREDDERPKARNDRTRGRGPKDLEDYPEKESRSGVEGSRGKRSGENGHREYVPDVDEYGGEDEERPRARNDRTRGRQSQDLEDASGDPSERRRYDQMRETPRNYERKNGHRWDEYEGGNSDYGTEFEDLEDYDRPRVYAREAAPSRSTATNPDHLDVNLISNLVRWAAHAKSRMGPERLMDFLELYLRSGNHSREMRETEVDPKIRTGG